jgi:hypothetical protein
MRTARTFSLATAAVFTAIAGCTDAGVLGPELPRPRVETTPVVQAPIAIAPVESTTSSVAPSPTGSRVTALSPIPFDGSTSGELAPSGACLHEGSRFGHWELRYHGYGCVTVEAHHASDASSDATLFMTPVAAQSAGDTHAPLVLGPSHGDEFTLKASVETVQHTRRGDTPNPWEVAWVVWQYQDDEHFYYFIPKPNGWELGKRDPAYPGGQRFLATGTDRVFPIGRVHHVTVQQTGTLLTVAVDGVPLVQFRDTERPYRAGRVALYAEDAAVRVHRVAAL